MESKFLIWAALTFVSIALIYYGSQNSVKQPQLLQTDQFAQFVSGNNKVYNEVELNYRKMIFQQNLDLINRHNENPNTTYKLGINRFADMTFEEFKKFYLIDFSQNQQRHKCEKSKINLKRKIPDEVDWRKNGFVQIVKFQGNYCGSCYAFSAIGGLESAIAQKKGKDFLPNLSEQELVDCSEEYGNQGCWGGLMSNSYDYIFDHKISLQQDYPYIAEKKQCDSTKSSGQKIGIKGCKFVPKGVNSLTQVASERVVPVALVAQQDFVFYKSGIYQPMKCDKPINHGVLLIGYNLQGRVPYYIIKNSWSEDWGEKGFMRMAIGKGLGTCGIASHEENYYPVL